jgi:signal transduction histidine kinase
MPDRWRTVRVRLTLAAVVVAGLVVLLAGLWLVRTVDGSLRDRQRDQDVQRLAELRAELEQGRRPGELEVVVPGRTTFFEVRVDQRRVAATPGYGDLPEDRVLLTTARVETSTGVVELVAASPIEPIERSVDAVQRGLLLALPALVVAAGILTWVLAGRALRPVEAIRAEVESISGSTLDRRVPVPDSGDEVARLADTMNAMLDRLQAASARQQRFVADASHELRSPVATIRTELEVAQRTARPEEWPAVADRLLAEEARLEAIIADLLLLATLDEGAPMPDAQAVDLADEARVEARRHDPDRTEVVVAVDAPGPAVVQGSRTQLRRALANLLDNAGRHARTTVRISVRAGDGRVRVLVDDDGPGIPEPDRERVFERLVRLDDHRARSGAGGSGLGLSIVRRIAERHDGTATVDTAPLGGARLVLDLPAAPSAPT